MITPKMFSTDTLKTLKSSGKINGVLLLGVNETNEILKAPTQFSGDATCPNKRSSLYKNSPHCQKWNPYGDGLLLEDWSFPIFLIDDEVKVNQLLDCYKDFNEPKDNIPRSWPLCAAELTSHMISSVDTKAYIDFTSGNWGLMKFMSNFGFFSILFFFFFFF